MPGGVVEGRRRAGLRALTVARRRRKRRRFDDGPPGQDHPRPGVSWFPPGSAAEAADGTLKTCATKDKEDRCELAIIANTRARATTMRFAADPQVSPTERGLAWQQTACVGRPSEAVDLSRRVTSQRRAAGRSRGPGCGGSSLPAPERLSGLRRDRVPLRCPNGRRRGSWSPSIPLE